MKKLLMALLSSCTMLALAQDPCDDLDIISVHYAPFTDTALQVTVIQDNGAFFFGYPQFSLVDQAGDTLARELLNFFGISSGSPSIHRMELTNGNGLPGTPFTGTLILDYFTGEGPQQCVFSLEDVPLCPPGPCTPMQVYVVNNTPGSAISAGFEWHITNDEGLQVASGTMSIDVNGQQQELAEVCLPIGGHVLHVQHTGMAAAEFIIGVTQGIIWTPGPSGTLAPGSSTEVPFIHYPGCASIGMDVHPEVERPSPLLIVNGRELMIRHADDRPLGGFMLVGMDGKVIGGWHGNTSQAHIDVSHGAAGIYVVRSFTDAWKPQRIMLE